MTISSSTRKAGPYTGTGTTATYPFAFKVFQASDLLVVRTSLAGVESTLVLNTDYTVSLNADQNSSPGGTVTLLGGNLATGVLLTLASQVPLTQSTDLTNQGGFYPAVINNALDKLTIITQQLNEQVSRSAKLPISSTTDAATLVNNINTLATNLPTVQSVNANQANINAVAGNSTNINTVAANIANVNTVGGISTSVTAVAGNNANVSTVAANITAVNTASTNIAAIIAAPTQATNAANSASSAAASAAQAAASAASGMYSAVQDIAADYTVVASDAGDLLRVNTSGGARTITLPLIGSAGVDDGFKIAIVKWTGDLNAVTVARSGSNTINGGATYPITGQYSSATFVADAETGQWFAVASGLGTSNVVVDTFTGNGTQTAFTLSGDPGTKNNTDISIEGAFQLKATYTLAAGVITFSTAPPAGARIEVEWSQPLAVGVPSDGTVTPAKLSQGGPSWDAVGNFSLTSTGTAVFRTNAGSVSAYMFGSSSGALAGFGSETNHPVVTYVNGVERMRVDTSGNVGIGASSPTERLTVNGGGVRITGALAGSGANAAALDYSTNLRLLSYGPDASTAGALTFWGVSSNGSIAQERARIDSSGNFMLGGTSVFARQTISHDGSTAFGLACVNTAGGTVGQTAIRFMRNGADVGSITTTNIGTSYNTSSDYRLKDNIQPMTGALSKVAALKPCTYTWKADGSDGEGFIAHELQAVVPQCVTGEKDAVDSEGKPVYQGIDTSFLVATLTAAIQELKGELDATKAEIAALKGAA